MRVWRLDATKPMRDGAVKVVAHDKKGEDSEKNNDTALYHTTLSLDCQRLAPSPALFVTSCQNDSHF